VTNERAHFVVDIFKIFHKMRCSSGDGIRDEMKHKREWTNLIRHIISKLWVHWLWFFDHL